MKNIEIHDLSELLSNLGKNSGRCTKWRNPAAQDLMAKYRLKAIEKLNKVGLRLATDVIMPRAINEITGLKGAVTLIRRVTGKDHSSAIPCEDDSALGIYMHDALIATGIQSKMDHINMLYGNESIRLDMITDYDEAIEIVGGFKHHVNQILAEPPTVVPEI